MASATKGFSAQPYDAVQNGAQQSAHPKHGEDPKETLAPKYAETKVRLDICGLNCLSLLTKRFTVPELPTNVDS